MDHRRRSATAHGGRALSRERIRDAWVAAIAFAIGLAFVLWLARRPTTIPPECAERYAHARTAEDTAIVDAVRLNRRQAHPPTCGFLRRVVEQRRAGANSSRSGDRSR